MLNKIAVMTHIGNVRTENQDYGDYDHGIAVLCDGMGGLAGGRRAAEVAAAAFLKVAGDRIATCRSMRVVEKVFRNALISAKAAVFRQSDIPGNSGCGTTLVAAFVKDGSACLINVGDSRGYLWSHTGGLKQLTTDHDLYTEKVAAGVNPGNIPDRDKHILVQCLGAGMHDELEPTLVHIDELPPNGVLLLCSDGLSNMVNDVEIAKILSSSYHPKDASDRLIDAALKGGGKDNISVILIML